MLVVVDTNVWISAIITPASHSASVTTFLDQRRFEAVFCERTLVELKDTITEPKFVARHGLRLSALNKVIALMTQRGTEFPDPTVGPISRDPDDDVFIALAVASNADYLVTRDDDLKGDPRVREYLADRGVTVVAIAEFIELLEEP